MSSSPPCRIPALLLPILVAAVAAAAAAEQQTACGHLEAERLLLGESIGLLPEPGVPPGVVERATDLWGTCQAYGTGFPSFLVGRPGTRNIRVRFLPRQAGERRCGSFSGSTITLHGLLRDRSGRIRPCGALVQNLAHELGHVLGLAHPPASRRCQHHVMAPLNGRNGNTRRVRPQECQLAALRWITPTEWGLESHAGESLFTREALPWRDDNGNGFIDDDREARGASATPAPPLAGSGAQPEAVRAPRR